MSDIVMANDVKVAKLQEHIDWLNTLELHLFINDVEPDGETVVGDLDECEDANYASFPVDDFDAAVINGDSNAETVAPMRVWQFDHDAGDFTVFGVYYTDPNEGESLAFSQRFSALVDITYAGQILGYTPKMLLGPLDT